MESSIKEIVSDGNYFINKNHNVEESNQIIGYSINFLLVHKIKIIPLDKTYMISIRGIRYNVNAISEVDGNLCFSCVNNTYLKISTGISIRTLRRIPIWIDNFFIKSKLREYGSKKIY